MDNRTLLEIEKLRIALHDTRRPEPGMVLNGVDLNISEGERVSVVGESGCGKSMTALSVMGLLPRPPMEWIDGRIIFKGIEINRLPLKEWKNIRGKEIGIIFQEPFSSLNPVMAVGHQIAETLGLHLGLDSLSIRSKTLKLLEDVGLPDPERIFRQYPFQLSGGMCQRIMIAMAVACGPSLLIADEPTTALDVTVQSQILDLLIRMTIQRQMALLFITHNLRLVREHSNRVIIFYAGQVVEQGTPKELFEHPQHPYTESLLASLPEKHRRGSLLPNIPGNVPTPFDVFPGCSFADRCLKRKSQCVQCHPILSFGKGSQWVRCFYPSNN